MTSLHISQPSAKTINLQPPAPQLRCNLADIEVNDDIILGCIGTPVPNRPEPSPNRNKQKVMIWI